MRTNFDFAPFRRSTVGFDRLFDLLESGSSPHTAENYPPFDLEHDGEDNYRITLAVAGFGPDEIDITAQQNLLIVSGRRSEAADDRGAYVHRGIAARSFERRFALGDFIKVSGADLKDGLLSISLVREIPDEMKPQKIGINQSKVDRIAEQTSRGRDSDNENHKSRRAA